MFANICFQVRGSSFGMSRVSAMLKTTFQKQCLFYSIVTVKESYSCTQPDRTQVYRVHIKSSYTTYKQSIDISSIQPQVSPIPTFTLPNFQRNSKLEWDEQNSFRSLMSCQSRGHYSSFYMPNTSPYIFLVARP